MNTTEFIQQGFRCIRGVLKGRYFSKNLEQRDAAAPAPRGSNLRTVV